MISIAIDGPAGAGKSTIAKGLASKLGYIYVDTGALYRTIALYMHLNNFKISDKDNVVKNLDNAHIELKYIDGAQRVILNGDDVSDKIRTPEVSMMASDVSAIPEVRAYLLDFQRSMAQNNNVIMDGRDIGTVVLPNATIKVFLTASVECRAERRYKELIEKGSPVTLQEVIDDIQKRDYNDSHRAIAPLKPALDSTTIDTSWKTLEESIKLMEEFVNEKLNNKQKN